mmetsp:Transcript_42268/g.72178  ORF Transcript_42268/g.72178 Transcript_42268/m.72178 type:complete len:83 (-) Transcript_42268:277-525(-)
MYIGTKWTPSKAVLSTQSSRNIEHVASIQPSKSRFDSVPQQNRCDCKLLKLCLDIFPNSSLYQDYETDHFLTVGDPLPPPPI